MKRTESILPGLLERISLGDELAFGKVFRLFNTKLVKFATNYVRSHEVAEEIVEDVFVKLWLRRSEVAQINHLGTYLYIATKNRSLNVLNKEKVEFTNSAELPESELPVGYSTPHDNMVHSELMNSMQRAVDSLPERCKIIFKLIREDGLKYKEVAQVLDISVNTIDAQMAIAIKRICQSMGVDKESRKMLPDLKS